jgi:hypothetical protein
VSHPDRFRLVVDLDESQAAALAQEVAAAPYPTPRTSVVREALKLGLEALRARRSTPRVAALVSLTPDLRAQ